MPPPYWLHYRREVSAQFVAGPVDRCLDRTSERHLHTNPHCTGRPVEAPGAEEGVVVSVECPRLLGGRVQQVAVAEPGLDPPQRHAVPWNPPGVAIPAQVDRAVRIERAHLARLALQVRDL